MNNPAYTLAPQSRHLTQHLRENFVKHYYYDSVVTADISWWKTVLSDDFPLESRLVQVNFVLKHRLDWFPCMKYIYLLCNTLE